MKSKPKKLSLVEVWEMYKLLEDAIPDDLSISLLDAVDHVIDNISKDILLMVLGLCYSKKEIDNMSGLDALLLLVRCFKVNDFFLFAEFVRSIKW